MHKIKEYFLFTEQEIYEQTGMEGRNGVYMDLSKKKFERVKEHLNEINEQAKGFRISIANSRTRTIHIQNLSPKKGS